MKKIPSYKFYKHKYGDELLIDVISYEKMMPDIRRTPVFSETFYSISLVLEGGTTVALNGKSRRVARGTIVCSIPGEVWTLTDTEDFQALNLIFEKEFLLSFFNDPHFLDRFTYLQADRETPFMQPDEAAFDRILGLYQDMQREITGYEHQDQHILRAMLYETMMLLQRVPVIEAEQVDTVQRSLSDIPVSRYADDFVSLVHDYFREEHGTEFYADRLCITPNYLNKVVRQTLGLSAKSYILDQLLSEACRLLKYTTLTVGEIAAQLHFDTATYFVRIFRKYKGLTPLEFRQQNA
ncbi:MAG: helix-turn-helix transcriptional regulator [Bacteroidales bacterium]|nr:helix-turn-helix transcriptional regulator [Bacteroidales bacterium]